MPATIGPAVKAPALQTPARENGRHGRMPATGASAGTAAVCLPAIRRPRPFFSLAGFPRMSFSAFCAPPHNRDFPDRQGRRRGRRPGIGTRRPATALSTGAQRASFHSEIAARPVILTAATHPAEGICRHDLRLPARSHRSPTAIAAIARLSPLRRGGRMLTGRQIEEIQRLLRKTIPS